MFLFDMTGTPLDAYVPLTMSDDTPEPSWEAFWEGDAYSAVWIQSGKIAYQRFLIE